MNVARGKRTQQGGFGLELFPPNMSDKNRRKSTSGVASEGIKNAKTEEDRHQTEAGPAKEQTSGVRMDRAASGRVQG